MRVVELPTVLCEETLPLSKHDIISCSDLKMGKYLQDVPLPIINGDVGHLIGSNVSNVI